MGERLPGTQHDVDPDRVEPAVFAVEEGGGERAARTAPDIFRRELHGQADPLFGGGERLAVKFFRISFEPLRDPDFRDETLHLFFHAFLLSWLTEKYSMRRAACQCCIPPRHVLL